MILDKDINPYPYRSINKKQRWNMNNPIFTFVIKSFTAKNITLRTRRLKNAQFYKVNVHNINDDLIGFINPKNTFGKKIKKTNLTKSINKKLHNNRKTKLKRYTKFLF